MMRKTLGLICMMPVLAWAVPVAPSMTALWPGDVKPTGWLRDRAYAARDGYTGHMDEVDRHFQLAWTTNCMRRGKLLNWDNAHRGSWSAEGGAYWFDGLVRLAWQLDDADLKAQARRRLDPILDNVGENSIGFLWWLDRRNPDEVKEALRDGEWQFWVIGMAERVIAAWYQATGDERALRTLRNAYGFETIARHMGRCAPFVSGLEEAYRLTGDAQVGKCLDLACESLNRFALYAKPPEPWLIPSLILKRKQQQKMKYPMRHGVYASEELLSLVRAYQHTGDGKLRDSVVAWYDFFDAHCRQPYGVTMMDEEWGWAGVDRGTETCDVAAEPYARMNLLAALGDGRWGDDVERAVFNAGPACVSRDFKRGVYFQLPNRVGKKGEGDACSTASAGHTDYTRSHWPLCCTAALNRILPNYIQYMWLKTAEGGLAAALYGPATVSAELPAGKVVLEEHTNYPFEETISVTVKTAPKAAFPVKFRLPAWCANPTVCVNGQPVAIERVKGFVTLSRLWTQGDRVELRFPMVPRFEDFKDMNDLGRDRRSLLLGPLLFAYDVPSVDDNTPRGTVREPELARSLLPSEVSVRRSPMPTHWNWPANSPVRLEVMDADGCLLSLIPYGCTKLHVSAFGFADRVYVPMPLHEVRPRQGIGRTLEKLSKGEEVAVAFLGDFGAAGNGSLDRMTDWLRKTYPRSRITEVDAMRKPGLVFVGPVKDASDRLPSQIWRETERQVRMVWKADPKTDIVFVYPMAASSESAFDASLCNRAVGAMEMLADHYGIPSIAFKAQNAERSLHVGFAAMNGIRPVDHAQMLRREPFVKDRR